MENLLLSEEMIAEMEELKNSEAVKLARKEVRLRYKERQKLYTLRNLKKRGEELLEMGVTMDNIEEMMHDFYLNNLDMLDLYY